MVICQVFVKPAPGLKIVPSTMVSLSRLAFAHSNFVVPGCTVGDAASGVRVGNNCTGVCITGVAGAEGVSAFAACSVFCAATVCATAVWMVASCAFPAPQAVRNSAVSYTHLTLPTSDLV